MTELVIIRWNEPKTSTPDEGQFIMIEYQKTFWTGTYSNDIVKMSPDYLGWVALADCKRWAAWEQDDG